MGEREGVWTEQQQQEENGEGGRRKQHCTTGSGLTEADLGGGREGGREGGGCSCSAQTRKDEARANTADAYTYTHVNEKQYQSNRKFKGVCLSLPWLQALVLLLMQSSVVLFSFYVGMVLLLHTSNPRLINLAAFHRLRASLLIIYFERLPFYYTPPLPPFVSSVPPSIPPHSAAPPQCLVLIEQILLSLSFILMHAVIVMPTTIQSLNTFTSR